MFGFHEILVVIGVVLGIIFLPRMLPRRPAEPKPPKTKIEFSGRMRAAVAVSLVYPLIVAAVLQPWRKEPLLFVYAGIAPVVLGWLCCWVLLGFKRR